MWYSWPWGDLEPHLWVFLLWCRTWTMELSIICMYIYIICPEYIYIYLHWCHGLIFGRLRVWFWTSFIFKQNGNHEWTMNNISSLRFDSSEPQAEGFRSAICFREFADGSWGGKLETFISFPQVDRGGGIRKLAYKKKSVAVYPDGRGGEPCTKLNLYIYILIIIYFNTYIYILIYVTFKANIYIYRKY